MTEAARRSGRRPDEVRLVAVTKFVSETAIRAVVAAGCRVLGESRPQHLWDRAAALSDLSVEWHLIGPLQRNKVRRTLPLVGLLHSADSEDLVLAIDRIAGELGRVAPLLLEVNCSGDEAKHGFEPEAVAAALDRLAPLRHVQIRGFMGMAALDGGSDVARRNFSLLRKLRDRLRSDCPPAISLDELSMGMSGDFEVAIEEGATLVRVGSALFEGLAP